MLLELLADTLLDCIKMLPFLLAAFFILELLEHYSGDKMNRVLGKVGKAGPAVGALLGCIPQCGFSVVAANLYSGGVITMGTLLSVFLATSDEALLILMGYPGQGESIFTIIVAKVVIALVAGYLIDLIFPPAKQNKKDMDQICTDCGCHNHRKGSVARAALNHTLRIFIYILVFTLILNLAIQVLGVEGLSAYLLGDSLFQPLIAGVIGIIPNCAASVILTELYLSGAISFASVIAGLCTGAGIGLVVLFKMNRNKKENFKILGLLYGISAAAGILLELAMR